MENYPNNSHKVKNDSRGRDDKNVKPVISGKTELKKKNKFLETILSEDILDIRSHIISDVLIPILIRTVSDIAHNTVDTILGGRGDTRKRNNVDRYSWREPISYENRYQNSDRYYRYGDGDFEEDVYNYRNIMYYSRSDAIEVLKGLDDLICRYKIATVLDLYDLSNRGDETRPSDNKYGWDDLRSAHVERAGNKWVIILPKAKAIE